MFNTKKLTKLFAIGALALGVLVVAGCGDDTSKDAKVNPCLLYTSQSYIQRKIHSILRPTSWWPVYSG